MRNNETEINRRQTTTKKLQLVTISSPEISKTIAQTRSSQIETTHDIQSTRIAVQESVGGRRNSVQEYIKVVDLHDYAIRINLLKWSLLAPYGEVV